MTKEVEDIIRNKAYNELTGEERAYIKEWAQNEEEYANMQWFLLGAGTTFNANKIQASPELKKGVMEHLTESKKKRGFWLNSVGLFLLPEGKKIYQKPAFQIGIAAMLVVGALFFFDNGIEENSLAINETVTPEESIQQKNDLVEQDRTKEGESFEKEVDKNLENNQEDLAEVPEPAIVLMDNEDAELSSDMSVAEDVADYDGYLEPVMEEVLEVEEAPNEVYETIVLADEVSDEEEKEMGEAVDQVEGVNPGYFADAELSEVVEKSDRRKDKRLRLEKKVSGSKDEGRANNVPALDMDEVTTGGAVRTAEGNEALTIGKEEIYPKALHINQTKELNALFHIEK